MRTHRDSGGIGRHLLAYGVALVCGAATAAAGLAWLHSGEAHADAVAGARPIAVPASAEDAPLGPPIPADHLEVVRGDLRAGETLHSTLTRMGVSAATVHEIAVEMRPLFDFRYAKPGDRYRLARTADGSVVDFEYRTSAVDGYRLFRVGDELVARSLDVNLVRRVETLAGIVTNSVYNAIRNLGESGQLAHDFSELFAWEVDFNREVRPGDEFRVLYERLYQEDGDGNEVYVRPGRILAAQYRSREVHTAIHYKWDDENEGYYRPDGTAMERQFLRAPHPEDRMQPVVIEGRGHAGVLEGRRSSTPA